MAGFPGDRLAINLTRSRVVFALVAILITTKKKIQKSLSKTRAVLEASHVLPISSDFRVQQALEQNFPVSPSRARLNYLMCTGLGSQVATYSKHSRTFCNYTFN